MKIISSSLIRKVTILFVVLSLVTTTLVLIKKAVVSAVVESASQVTAQLPPYQTITPSTVHVPQGYSLQPREISFLSFMLKEEASAFKINAGSIIGTDLIKVSAIEVAKAYDENQIAADQKYLKKRLRVSGIIESINSGLANEPYLSLRGSNMFLSPQARFDLPNIEKIASLKKGTKVDMICDFTGTVISTPMFQSCLFADDYATQEVKRIMNEVHKFLSGNTRDAHLISFGDMSLESLVVVTILMARALPDNSTCFSDGSKCKADLDEVTKTKIPAYKWKSVYEELSSKGVHMSNLIKDEGPTNQASSADGR